jgi:hypothetical protein
MASLGEAVSLIRSMPTVGVLLGIRREGKSQIDPKLKRELLISAMVKDARARGYRRNRSRR